MGEEHTYRIVAPQPKNVLQKVRRVHVRAVLALRRTFRTFSERSRRSFIEAEYRIVMFLVSIVWRDD